MLENIHIQNFRCFEDFKAEGFERVNLIGGKNNSGKSCLLEAIACLAQNYLFQEMIVMRGNLANSFTNINNPYDDVLIVPDFDIKKEDINFYDGDKIQFKYSKGSFSERNVMTINFILSDNEIPKLDIVRSFDTFDEKLKKHRLIQILQSVDERIEDIRTFKTKEGLWIKKFNEEYQSINFYGDAIKKIIKYFTPFFEKSLYKNSYDKTTYLLIDEIENGIHYSAHYDFWKAMFKLSKELNIQIFATTHSLEMIQQFNKVAIDESEGAYFEMNRNEIDNSIHAIKHSTNVLEEELESNAKIRGEVFKDKLYITEDLLQSLNNAATTAKQNLKENKIAVPFIKDGWLWETLPNGTERQLEKLEPLKTF